MEEISLHIHTSGQESHEISVAPDIETGEFIRELIGGLNLGHADVNGQPLIWEADDKDTGHTLVPGRTLQENGVRDRHHLYLKNRPAPQPVPPPPVEGKREIPQPPLPLPGLPPNPPRWPLFLAVALIPVAAAGSYLWGAGPNRKLEAALRASQAEATSADRRASAAEALAAEARAQLTEVKTQQGGVSAEAKDLKAQVDNLKQALNLKQSQFNAKDAQIRSQQTKLDQLNDTAIQLRAADAHDQDQLKQLQSSAQKAQALQNELNAARQTIATLEQQKLQSQSAAKAAPPVRPRFGSIVWTGDIPQGNLVEIRDSNRTNVGRLLDGRLPGLACAILVADPDKVSIVAEPESATNWNQMVFRVNGKGKTTVRLFWIAM